jgi:acetylornithine/succinyldiaminopimelate/putrescine aminotransferase
LLCKETHTHTIGFVPPPVIKRAEIDWAVAQIDAVLKAALSSENRLLVVVYNSHRRGLFPLF